MSTAQTILRFAMMIALFGAVLFGCAGRWNIPAFWALLGLMAVSMPGMYFAAGPELMKERQKPGPGGKDQLIRILAAPIMAAHLAIAGLDVGRFHWSGNVPPPLQIFAFAVLAGCLGTWGVAMHENQFFSTVIRIQRDRGHRVVDTGPYRFVRHPGYAALLAMQATSGIALGSYWSMAPSALMAVLCIRRTALEDRTLQEQLEGYREYAQRVRYRLAPGIW